MLTLFIVKNVLKIINTKCSNWKSPLKQWKPSIGKIILLMIIFYGNCYCRMQSLDHFHQLSAQCWNNKTTSGRRQWGTKKKSPTKDENKNRARHVEIALACRSLVISFVSNVLIVTDYMLLSSPWHLLYSMIDFCAPVWKGHFDQCSVIGNKLGSYQVILLFNDEILKNSMCSCSRR